MQNKMYKNKLNTVRVRQQTLSYVDGQDLRQQAWRIQGKNLYWLDGVRSGSQQQYIMRTILKSSVK